MHNINHAATLPKSQKVDEMDENRCSVMVELPDENDESASFSGDY